MRDDPMLDIDISIQQVREKYRKQLTQDLALFLEHIAERELVKWLQALPENYKKRIKESL